MKKIMIIMAALALISVSARAGTVEMKTSGPSGQGDLIWWAPKTGTTNFAMGTGGLYNVTIDPRYPVSGTVTKQTGAVTASGANNLVTPTATITKQTGAVTATATPTLQTPGAQTPTITVTVQATTIYDSTGAACTNGAGEVVGVVTGATATSSALPDFPTNLTIAVSVVGGDAVMTNATCTITPDLASNSVVAVTVTGGSAVMTNATIAIP